MDRIREELEIHGRTPCNYACVKISISDCLRCCNMRERERGWKKRKERKHFGRLPLKRPVKRLIIFQRYKSLDRTCRLDATLVHPNPVKNLRRRALQRDPTPKSVLAYFYGRPLTSALGYFLSFSFSFLLVSIHLSRRQFSFSPPTPTSASPSSSSVRYNN